MADYQSLSEKKNQRKAYTVDEFVKRKSWMGISQS